MDDMQINELNDFEVQQLYSDILEGGDVMISAKCTPGTYYTSSGSRCYRNANCNTQCVG